MAGELGFDTGPFVAAAMFVDTVIEGKDDVLSLIRVIDRMTVNAHGPNVPDDIPPGIVRTNLVVMLKAGKARGAQRFRVDMELPDGSRKKGPEQTVHFTPGESGGVSIFAPLAIEIVSAGLYWTDVFINDRLMSRVPLEIRYSFTRQQESGETPPQ